ncbi:Cullin [Suillus subluteus]|nr:Cullin [Suillus subluteus]
MTTDESVSPDDRKRLYTAAYDYCSAYSPYHDYVFSSRAGESVIVGCPELYGNVIEYFINRVELLKDQCDSLQDEALLRHYANAWNRYSTGANIINQIFSNTENDSNIHEEEEDQRRVFSVYTMALGKWKGVLISHLHKTLCNVILSLINRQRDGETIDQSLVKTVVDSFVFFGSYIYEADLETPFLNETEKYYEPESQLFLSRGNLLDYLKKVGQCLKEEEDRVDQYLSTGTRNKLLSKCEYMLVRPHSRLIRETFQRLLDREKEELQSMYASLSRTRKCLEPLRQKFEEHVKKAGLTAVVTLLGEEGDNSLDPKAYVDTLLEVCCRYSGFVMRIFGGETGFVASLDKACREFVNRNAVTGSSTTKSPELLVKHADALLRKNNKMTEWDLEAALSDAMVLFKYIEDKDVFQSFYYTKLSKRLFHGISASDESEASMISKLKEACGFEYIQKLQKMFTDISLSKNLTDEFNEHMQTHDEMNMNFSIMVLNSNSWPLSAPKGDFIIPPEIIRTYDHFLGYFQTKHSGRQLTWLWNYSTNELRTNYLNQKYILMTSSYQMAVLLQYNTHETSSLDELVTATGINKDILSQVLVLLVKAKILINEDTNQYDLNPSVSSFFEVISHSRDANTFLSDFKSKKTRISLNRPIKAEVKADSSELSQTVEKDRKHALEATVVRIMKARKTLKIQPYQLDLHAEVTSA